MEKISRCVKKRLSLYNFFHGYIWYQFTVSVGQNNSGSVKPLENPSIKGVGAIYIRRRPRVRVEALQSGGGQERGMRSGTVPTPLAVGLGAACEIASQESEVSLSLNPNSSLTDKINSSLPLHQVIEQFLCK